MNRISTNIKLVRQLLSGTASIRSACGERIVPYAFSVGTTSSVVYPLIVISIAKVAKFDSFDVADFKTRTFEVSLNLLGTNPEQLTDLADDCVVALVQQQREWTVDGERIRVQTCGFTEAAQLTPRPSQAETPTSDFIFEWQANFILITNTT